MKSRLDELYQAKTILENEIERIKRIQNGCDHIFTPLINDVDFALDDMEDRWYRRCVQCDKIEYTNSLNDPEYVSELKLKPWL